MSSRLMSELDDSTRKLLKPRMEGTGQDRTENRPFFGPYGGNGAEREV